MAMVKDDGSIMYSNKALAKLLEYETLPDNQKSQYSQVGVKSDPSQAARKMLESVKIKKYEAIADGDVNPAMSPRSQPSSSVWDYITKKSEGATYEIVAPPTIPIVTKPIRKNDSPNITATGNDGFHSN